MATTPGLTTRQMLLGQFVRRLEAGGIDDATRNAEWLLGEVLGCSRAQLYAYPEAEVPYERVAQATVMLERRLRHEPLQYILGHTDFFGLRIEVTPAVLIPRPETEVVVERALDLIVSCERPRVLDMGTGSGCIALALRHERPAARVVGCDASGDALDVARSNAARLDLDVTFVEADVLAAEARSRLPSSVDLLISNPPYIPEDEAETLAPEVHKHEPHRALFAGADPLRFYRVISRLGIELVAAGGWLVFELHSTYAGLVVELVRGQGWHDVQVYPDLAGRDRVVVARQPASEG